MNNAVITSLEPSEQLLPVFTGRIGRPSIKAIWIFVITILILAITSVLVWQIVILHGSSATPTDIKGLSPAAVVMDSGILVFREGLEAILVLAALTASLVRTQDGYWKPVAMGAGASFLASIATWFIVVAIISDINASALNVQAATGLIAIIVLLVIMNWFFHKIYWTGWITHHNRRKQSLTQASGRSSSAIFRGLVLVGFTSVYREGFEVVLFLQSMRLKAGSLVILEGVLIGLSLTLIVALLTFVAHYRLPYKRMLVLTGIMLGAVLLVMVGEQVQEMQQAGWISTHAIINIPDSLGTWFALYGNAEGLLAQLFAGTFVIGSYYLARRVCNRRPTTETAAQCIVPDCANCSVTHENHEQLVPLGTPTK